VSTQEANKRLGTAIEERRAEARGAEHTPEQEYYDLRDDGTQVEVKSTKRTIQNPNYNRTGRYQLEPENHHELVEVGGVYDFVLRNSENDIVDVRTLAAENVDRLLAANDRTWPTGSKLKLRYDQIHNE